MIRSHGKVTEGRRRHSTARPEFGNVVKTGCPDTERRAPPWDGFAIRPGPGGTDCKSVLHPAPRRLVFSVVRNLFWPFRVLANLHDLAVLRRPRRPIELGFDGP